MDELIVGFAFFAIFLIVLAAIGHGLWLLTAAFFRFIFGGPSQAADGERPGARPSAETRLKEDFLAAKRLLQYAKFRTWLPQEKIAELDQLLNDLQARSRSTTPKPVGAPSQQPKPDTESSLTSIAQAIRSEMPRSSEPSLPVPRFDREHIQNVTPPVVTPAPAIPVVQPVTASANQPETRDAHALDQEYRNKAPQPAVHKRLTADVIYAFMQKANVRWIELISAALIVVCSTGLVISLWSTLAATSRFFPALIFCLATIAIHAAGHYTLSQWKLRNTSRGILHIANMLIPLSVMAGLLLSLRSDQKFSIEFFSVIAIVLGALVYGFLIIWTSRTLFAARHWLVSSTLIASCISLVVTHIVWGYQFHSWLGDVVNFAGLLACNAATAAVFTRLLGVRAAHQRSTSQRMQRMSYQILFATIAAMGFYAFRNRTGLLQQNGFWLFTYLMIAVWIAYGVGAVSVFLQQRRLHIKQTANSLSSSTGKDSRINFQLYTLMACAFVTFFIPLLLFALWQISDNRILLAIAVAAITAWLIFLQQKTTIPISRLAIAIGCCATATIMLEGLFNRQLLIYGQDWLEWPKVVALIVSGFSAIAASIRLTAQWKKPAALAGTIHLVLATLLSSITAVLQILGIRSFALWPEIVMGTLGLGFLVAANVRDVVQSRLIDHAQGKHSRLTVALTFLGLAFFSAFVFHLVQVNPFLESRLALMRPIQSIPIALGCVSAVTSLFLLARQVIPAWRIRPDAMQFTDKWVLTTPVLFQSFSIATAMGCAIQAWIPQDSFDRILTVGWCVPLSFFALASIKKWFATNELLRFVSAFWIGLATFHVGYVNQWWQNWDAAYSSVIFFVILSTVTALLYALDRWLASDAWLYESLPVIELAAVFGCGAIGLQIVGRSINALLAGLNQAVEPPSIPESSREILVLVVGSLGVCVTPLIAYAIQGRQKPKTEILALVGGMFGALSLLLVCWLVPTPYNLLVLLWLSFLISLASFIPSKKDVGLWSRLKLNPDSTRILGAVGGTLVVLISLAMGYSAFQGTLRPPLLVLNRAEDTIFASLARWIPTLSWSLPLQILLLVHWLRSGKQPDESGTKDQFGWAWISSPAGWIGFDLLFLGDVAQLRQPQFLFQFGQLLIATFSGLLIFAIAIGRYRKCSNVGSAPGMTKCCLDEAALALCVGMTISLIAFFFEYAFAVQNGFGITVFPEFASRTAVFAVVLQMIAIGLVPRWLTQLSVWRRMLFVVPMLAVPLLLSVAWQWQPTANLLNNQLGWLDERSIGAVILAGLLAHAICTFVYLPLARINFGELTAQQGQQWATAFVVLRGIAYCLLIGVAVIASLRFVDREQVSRATGVLSLTFLLWSFIAAKTRWGIASTAMATIAGVAFSQWRGYDEPSQLYFTATTAPVIIAWSSLLLGQLHERLVNLWSLRRPEVSVRYNKRVRRASIELIVAYMMPVALALTCIVITRLQGSTTPRGVITHSIFLIAAVYTLVVVLWLQRSSVHLLRLCYFASMPMFALPLIWFAHQQDLTHRMQSLFAILGVTASVVFNSIIFRLAATASQARLPKTWQNRLLIFRFDDSSNWMHVAATLVSIVLVTITIAIVAISSEIQLRSIAVVIPLLSAAAIGVLPFKSQSLSEHKVLRQSRIALLSFITVAGMLLAIRDLDNLDSLGDANGIAHLRRCFIAAAALLWMFVFTASRKLFSEAWTYYLYRFGWLNYAIGGCLGLLMLFIRVARPEVAIEQSILEEIVVFAAWIALIYRSVQFATAPFENEIEKSVSQRSLAVYGVQALLLGIGTEFYFDHPELFGTWLAAWWPVIVFIIALASIALGTMTRLDQSTIFGGPTRQLNLVMPLIPLLGVWLNSENRFWQDTQVFGGLMLGAAILYGVQSWVYRSAIMQMVSIACGIISFWCFIFEFEWARIWNHPQLWLLPPAVVALYLIETNRRLFSRSVLTAMRYVVILIAYLSSTADLLLMAFSGSFWMPIILMALSIAGFLSGMVFRISALLICSVVFIFVALVGMVWHAQQAIHHTGPWWVFGIASGTALIFALGYFEKNRSKVNDYLQKLRAWDASDA